MLPADKSWSTTTAGMQAIRLADARSNTSSLVLDAPDPAGRKRRRIAPIADVPQSTISCKQSEVAGPSRTLNTTSSTAPTNWDYLAKWEQADSSIVEDLDEEEFCFDIDHDSPDAVEEFGQDVEEMDDLPPECPTSRPSKLGDHRIIEIINECIENYAKAWTPGKDETKSKDEEGRSNADVPVLYDPIMLWEEAEAAGEREELAKRYELEGEYYKQRLDKLCEEIAKAPGDTIDGVKKKCRNLEVTVELLERADWLASIYRLPPEDDRDKDSQAEEIVSSSEASSPNAWPLDLSKQEDSSVEVIDLGSPSGSSVLGSDETTTRARRDEEQGSSSSYHLSTSDPIVTETIESPGPAKLATATATARSYTPLGDAPEHASIATVSRWSWTQLIDTHDRKRIVSKAIYDLGTTDREMIRQRLQNVGRAYMAREIPACVDMLLRGDTRMSGVLPQDLLKIVTFTRLFLCWWLCGNYFLEEPSKWCLEDLADCLGQNIPDPTTFCDYVDTILNTTFSRTALNKPTQPSQAEIIEISDDDDDDDGPLQQLPKRRKSNINIPEASQKSSAIVIN